MTTPADCVGDAVRDLDAAARPLRRALVERLVREGLLDDPAWRRAVESVPRHRFVPGFYAETGECSEDGLVVWEPVTQTIDAGRWLEAAYADTTLITQFDGDEPDWERPASKTGGAPSSSSTLPSLVVRMWIDADLAAGHGVLEVGTGTGYSTALACEFGAELTSVEIDPRRLDQAAGALYGCGYGPELAVADGLFGYRPGAPYDRIVAACSVRAVPDAWLAQVRPGGKILTTLSGWLYGSARVLLTVTDGATAEGALLPGTISFMAARTQNRPEPGNPAHWAALTRDSRPRPVRYGPRRLEEPTAEGFFERFLAQLAVPGAQIAATGDTVHLIDVTTGSVATFDGDGEVRQAGPLRLWDGVEAAWDAWRDAGKPAPESFRVRIGDGRQTIDHPASPGLSFTLPR